MADDTTNFDVTISTSTELDVASRINALHEDAECISKLAKSQAQKFRFVRSCKTYSMKLTRRFQLRLTR